MIAAQYYRVQGGILVPICREADYDWSALMKAEEVNISLAEFGLVVTVGELEIPIPEVLFDYITENPTIVFYHVADTLMAEPAATIVIDKNAFAEAKGAYKFAKMSRGDRDDAIEKG